MYSLDSHGCRVSSTPVTIWLSSSGNDTFRLMYVFLEFERKHDGPTGTFDRESISKLLGNDLDFHSVITVGWLVLWSHAAAAAAHTLGEHPTIRWSFDRVRAGQKVKGFFFFAATTTVTSFVCASPLVSSTSLGVRRNSA